MSLEVGLDDAAPRPVAVTRLENDCALLWIDGRRHRGSLRRHGDGFAITLDDRTEQIHVVVAADEVFVHAFGRAWRTEVTDPAIRSALQDDAEDLARAPMPGQVITVATDAGQQVRRGDVLLVIESMKMQSEIVAWRDGVVERVHVEVGDGFERGADLVALATIEQEPAQS